MTSARSNARDRLDGLADTCADLGWAGLVIGPGDNLRWATGSAMSSHERLTLLCVRADRTAVVVVPELEVASLAGSVLATDRVEVRTWTDGQDAHALAREVFSAPGPVGVDEDLPARHVLPLLDRGLDLTPAAEAIRPHRMVKDAEEQRELREVSAAIDRVHARMGEFLRVGLTEREAADLIGAAMLAEGHAEVAFAIVGSAAHGADPHHEVSEKVLESGDIVVVDIGGPAPSGYGSDCTRTYVLGEPDAAHAEMIAVLERAQQVGVDAARPGATCSEVDAACRDVLAEAGLDQYFIHRTGHGIGLSAHEEPFVVAGDTTVLEPGMAITIEPGIYLSGVFGARIEDVVLITETGCERLNSQPHGLRALPGE